MRVDPRTLRAVPTPPRHTGRMSDFLSHVGVHDDDLPLTLTPGEEHANRNGTVHGGLLATLLDTACGHEARDGLEEGKSAATVSLTVTYLRPGTVGEELTASAQTLHRGGSLVMVEGDVHQGGEHIAHAAATFSVVDPE